MGVTLYMNNNNNNNIIIIISVYLSSWSSWQLTYTQLKLQWITIHMIVFTKRRKIAFKNKIPSNYVNVAVGSIADFE